MKTKEIKTFLPLFGGFYGTLYEPDYSNELEEDGLTDDDIEFDYKEYTKDVSRHACDWVEENCEFIKKVTFEELISPKYYNYSNDSINCTIDIDVKAFATYLIENKESLHTYLKEKYTSYDGFSSSYSNTFAEWAEETNNFLDLDVDGHRLGSLLDFYLAQQNEEQEEDIDLSMYYYVFENVYMSNYITILQKNVENLCDYEQKIVARNVIDTINMDDQIGYFLVLVNEYKARAEELGMDWRDMLCEDEWEEVIAASGITRVKENLEII